MTLPPDPPKGPGLVGPGAAVITALLASLALYEGTRLTPYRDIAGMWTVCDGITGPDVVPGKRYTATECDALKRSYVSRMTADIGRCIDVPLADGEWIAYGNFSYNVGTSAFCRSSIVRQLNAGDHAGACAQLTRWTYVAGKDCRVAANNCTGIVKRRQFERQTCEAAL